MPIHPLLAINQNAVHCLIKSFQHTYKYPAIVGDYFYPFSDDFLQGVLLMLFLLTSHRLD
jgi:hypothetical protein